MLRLVSAIIFLVLLPVLFGAAVAAALVVAVGYAVAGLVLLVARVLDWRNSAVSGSKVASGGL